MFVGQLLGNGPTARRAVIWYTSHLARQYAAPPDPLELPVANSTLIYVGLEVLYTDSAVTIWGPLDIGPNWLDLLYPDPDGVTSFGWIETPAPSSGCEPA